MRGCRPLDSTEINSICAHLPLRDRALFVLGIRTGFRISELLSLRIVDVWDGHSVRDVVKVFKRHTKGNAPSRCVALHAEAKAAVSAWIAECVPTSPNTDAPLFPSRKGGGALDRKSAWRILTQAFHKAGIQGVDRQLGTHCMRKTFAKRVYSALKHDLVKTQRALGHRDINSTAQYLSFDDDEITKAILGE